VFFEEQTFALPLSPLSDPNGLNDLQASRGANRALLPQKSDSAAIVVTPKSLFKEGDKPGSSFRSAQVN
jgi:hypothetical protein